MQSGCDEHCRHRRPLSAPVSSNSDRAMDHHTILSWADGHLNRLEVSITDFMKQYPYTLRQDYDDISLDHTTMVIGIGPFEPPDDWVFQIGDALHNMRVALDYLAYHVVTKHSSIVGERSDSVPDL